MVSKQSITLYHSVILTDAQRIAWEASDKFEDVLCISDDTDLMKLLTNDKATFEDIVAILGKQIRSTNIHILVECVL